MNGYTLIRNWYDFKFENPDKVRHIHSDFYCYLVDQWNRLGQKQNFGLPTSMTMEALGIGSYNTYKKTLEDLIKFGFVEMVKESRNQHQSKIVALSKTDKATDKPLDKATAKATDKPTDEATDKPTDTIIEPLNKGTIKQINQGTNSIPPKVGTQKKKFTETSKDDFEGVEKKYFIYAKGFWDIFYSHALELNLPKKNLDNANALDWVKQIRLMLENKECTEEQLMEVGRFLKTDNFWKPNVRSVPKLREKFENIYSSSKKNHGAEKSSLDLIRDKYRNQFAN